MEMKLKPHGILSEELHFCNGLFVFADCPLTMYVIGTVKLFIAVLCIVQAPGI